MADPQTPKSQRTGAELTAEEPRAKTVADERADSSIEQPPPFQSTDIRQLEHDLRSPLAALSAGLNVLERRGLSTEGQSIVKGLRERLSLLSQGLSFVISLVPQPGSPARPQSSAGRSLRATAERAFASVSASGILPSGAVTLDSCQERALLEVASAKLELTLSAAVGSLVQAGSPSGTRIFLRVGNGLPLLRATIRETFTSTTDAETRELRTGEITRLMQSLGVTLMKGDEPNEWELFLDG